MIADNRTARAPVLQTMSHTRHLFRLTLLTLAGLPACLGQSGNSNCLPLYGVDANHPNGLSLQLFPSKQNFGARPNTIPAVMTQLFNGPQIFWDGANIPQMSPVPAVIAALKSEFTACVPT